MLGGCLIDTLQLLESAEDICIVEKALRSLIGVVGLEYMTVAEYHDQRRTTWTHELNIHTFSASTPKWMLFPFAVCFSTASSSLVGLEQSEPNTT